MTTSTSDAAVKAAKATSTADDTLKQKSRDAETISGGHLVAKALKAEGVDTIYTLCGGHIIDIYDGCVDEGIDVIDVRHEQVAAHAADGHARITGKPGSAGDPEAVEKLADLLVHAEKPAILLGSQVWTCRATDAATELVRTLNVPA